MQFLFRYLRFKLIITPVAIDIKETQARGRKT